MVNYRRNRLKGATYFFTITLRDRRSNLLVEHIDALKKSFHDAWQEKPYKTKAIVILPEHIHAIWQLPEEDADYASRWRMIKSRFTREFVKKGIKLAKNERGEYSLWQSRFWEHTIKDELDLTRHIDYIHYNPVKHKLVGNVCDWKYSSFHRYVKAGVLSNEWAGLTQLQVEGSYGE